VARAARADKVVIVAEGGDGGAVVDADHAQAGLARGPAKVARVPVLAATLRAVPVLPVHPVPEARVMEATPAVRIDKWLWAVRIFRTRSAAATACNGGRVTVNGARVKPSRSIRCGDVITASTGPLTRTVKVTGLIERRVGAPLVANHLDDLTPPEEYAAARERAAHAGAAHRPAGSGRPTKRDRRILQSYFGDEE
jgi:ribosome-associated heat shock protein Hsp15